MIRFAALAWIVLLLPQDPPQEDLRARLEATSISVDHNGAFAAAIAELTEKLQVNIYVDPGVRDKADLEKKTRLVLTKVRASSALHWITRLYKLEWSVQGNLVVIGTPDTVHGAPEQRQYDAAVVGRSRTSAGAPQIRMAADGDDFICEATPAAHQGEAERVLKELLGGQANEAAKKAIEWIANPGDDSVPEGTLELIEANLPADSRPSARKMLQWLAERHRYAFSEDALIDVIKENVAPGRWEGAFTIERGPDNKLIVTHAVPTLDQVGRFLAGLRQMTPVSITVEADIVEADEALELRAGAARKAFLDPEEARSFRAAVRSLRHLRIACVEGQPAHAVAAGSDGADVLEVAAALVPETKSIRMRIDVKSGRRVAGADAVDLSLARFSTTALVPDGGSTVAMLPGKRALLIRATSGVVRTPPGIELFGPSPAESLRLKTQLEAAAPVDPSFENAPLEDVLAFFRRATGLNFVALPAEKLVTFRGKGVRPAAVLPMILRPLGMRLVPDHDAYAVVADESQVPLHLYMTGIRDIVLQPYEAQYLTFYDACNLIKNTVDRTSWEEADGKSIQSTADGVLIVRNTPGVIDKVRRLLAEIRARGQLVVTLNADFVTIDTPKARELLKGVASDSTLKEGEADLLCAAEGALVDRLTMRGLEGQPFNSRWSASRMCAALARRPTVVESSLEAKADPIEGGGLRVELALMDNHFTGSKRVRVGDKDIDAPTAAHGDLMTTILVPKGRVAVHELPEADGKSRLLLLRATLTRVTP